MKNQEGHWGYCCCRWVERTVQCEDNNNNFVYGVIRVLLINGKTREGLVSCYHVPGILIYLLVENLL